jgi:hypothetical protein
LGTTFQEAIKSRLKSRKACYHSIQKLLSSSLLAKNIQIKIHRTIILPVVLYGFETWSLTMREVWRLRVFERLLRRIFVPKRGEVIRKCSKLHNEELNVLYCSPNIVQVIKSSRKVRWVGQVACMENTKGVYMVLVGKPEGQRPLGRPRHRWEDNIKIDIQAVGCGGMD